MEHKPRRLELAKSDAERAWQLCVTDIPNTEDGQCAQRGLRLHLTGSTSEEVSGGFHDVIF